MKKLTKEQIEGVFEWMSNCEPLKHTDAATGFFKYYTNKIAQAEATDKDSGMALEEIMKEFKSKTL